MTTTETTIKERPILFSGPTVRAIIEGRKTQTRRIVKPQPANLGGGTWGWEGEVFWSDDDMREHLFHNVYGGDHKAFPYGGVYEDYGDRLWVRETFTIVPDYDILDDGAGTRIPCGDRIAYRADGNVDVEYEGVTWKPSIFMPRWASRLTLELTDVRVERLNDITEEDAIDEGLEMTSSVGLLQGFGWRAGDQSYFHAVDAFAALWNQINGKAHPWESNPWVFVIEFRRVD